MFLERNTCCSTRMVSSLVQDYKVVLRFCVQSFLCRDRTHGSPTANSGVWECSWLHGSTQEVKLAVKIPRAQRRIRGTVADSLAMPGKVLFSTSHAGKCSFSEAHEWAEVANRVFSYFCLWHFWNIFFWPSTNSSVWKTEAAQI